MSEAALQRKCVKWAEEHNWWARKFSSPGRAGVTDYIFARDGKVFFAEFKVKGKPLRPLQRREFWLMTNACLRVLRIESLEEFIVAAS